MMFLIRIFRLWLGIILSTYGIYLALNNTDRMVIQLPPFISQISLPIYLIAGMFLLAGSLLTMIFTGLDLFKKSLTIHQLKKKLRQYESEDSGSRPLNELGQTITVQPEIRI